MQRLDLAGEVVFLLVRRHTGVDGPVALGFRLELSLRFRFFVVPCDRGPGLGAVSLCAVGRCKGVKVGDTVSSVSTLCRRRYKTSVVGPRSEGTGADAKVPGCIGTFEHLWGRRGSVGCFFLRRWKVTGGGFFGFRLYQTGRG